MRWRSCWLVITTWAGARTAGGCCPLTKDCPPTAMAAMPPDHNAVLHHCPVIVALRLSLVAGNPDPSPLPEFLESVGLDQGRSRNDHDLILDHGSLPRVGYAYVFV